MSPKKDTTISRRLGALRLEEGDTCRKGRAMLVRKVPDAGIERSRRLVKKTPDCYGNSGVDKRRCLVKKVPGCYGNAGIEKAKDRRRFFKRGLEHVEGKGVVEEGVQGKGSQESVKEGGVKEGGAKDVVDGSKKNVVDEGEKKEATKQEDA